MRTFLICGLVFLHLISSGQAKLTENSVVKDSAGVVYPPQIWKGLLQNGYTLKMVNPQDVNTEFIIYKLPEKQWIERLEKMARPRESTVFKTGEIFHGFKTTDINGKKIDLKNLEGKIIVLNFWFINCAPCRSEIPELNKLVDSFVTNEKVIFLAVALDAKPDLNSFLKRTPFNYDIIDNGRFITEQYGIKSFPTHVIIDTEKKVYFHTMGLAPNTVFWLKKSINELLTNQATKSTASN
ncbi:MAG: TlpA family protein disulfide reductase [Flavisolibacter sp.]